MMLLLLGAPLFTGPELGCAWSARLVDLESDRSLFNNTWIQSGLPIRDGGLRGHTNAVDWDSHSLALPAFWLQRQILFLSRASISTEPSANFFIAPFVYTALTHLPNPHILTSSINVNFKFL
jgi:hypothetical protein